MQYERDFRVWLNVDVQRQSENELTRAADRTGGFAHQGQFYPFRRECPRCRGPNRKKHNGGLQHVTHKEYREQQAGVNQSRRVATLGARGPTLKVGLNR